MTAEQIRQRVLALQADRKPVPLDFPAWGDDIYIRVLSAADQNAIAEVTEQARMPIQVILHCLVDADGERIFGDGDEAAISGFPFPEVMQVFARVAKLNGMSTSELEEAMENFAPAPDEQRSIG